MWRAWACALVGIVTAQTADAKGACRRLDAVFRDGRVFVRYPVKGATLTLFTDTGGGGSLLSREAATRAGLAVSPASPKLAAELGSSAAIAAPPAGTGTAMPPIPGPLLVMPAVFPVPDWPEKVDGLLGQSWFAGKRWTLDYAKGELLLSCEANGRELPIALPPRDAPPPLKQFPRVEITVAGEAVPMLLDTGATTWLTDAALTAVGDGRPAIRATSMATASRISGWRARHPDWRVVENAQHGTGARMIEVPDVSIAGIAVGPVWFTERPDANFTRMMSAMMAGPVEGAIGGNAFADLRLTIDYQAGRAWIEGGERID